MTKRTTLDLGLSNGGESLNLRTKEIVVPPPKKHTRADKTTEQLVEWVSTLVSAADPIFYTENGPAVRGAERALTNRGLDLSQHLCCGDYDWQSLTSELDIVKDYFDYHGWAWGGE